MTTGTRLKKEPGIGMLLAKLLLSATVWACIGSFAGYHIGSAGGFRRGVELTANLFVSMMDARDANSNTPRKYTDL